jgi:3'-5' exonuclease
MAFAVFDIETRIDKHLLREVFFAGEALSDEEAYERMREQLSSRGRDFMPTVLHIPISIAVGNVGDDHVLHSVESLAIGDYSEEKLVREFWTRAERFPGCLVSFNGRRFDLPVLELQALRYGIALPAHFAAAPESARYRYSDVRHLDLLDFITNYGAFQVRGGMDLLLKLIGLPGKVGIDGSQVQAMYEAGRLDEIHRYCRNDVIQTYFLLLRVELMRGRIDAAAYETARAASAHFLEELKGAP